MPSKSKGKVPTSLKAPAPAGDREVGEVLPQIADEEPDYLKALRGGNFADPLSEVTRRERRNLLLISFVSLAVTLGNLVPQEITALGITVSATEQRYLFLLLAVGVLYLILAFIFYGHYDYRRWQLELHAVQPLRRKTMMGIQRHLRERSVLSAIQATGRPYNPADIERLARAAQAADDLKQSDRFIAAGRRRLWFEYSVPLLAGGWALALLSEGVLELQLLAALTAFLRAHSIVSTLVAVGVLIAALTIVFRHDLRTRWRKFLRWRDRMDFQRFMVLSRKAQSLPAGSPERERLAAELQESFERRLERLARQSGVKLRSRGAESQTTNALPKPPDPAGVTHRES